MFRRLLVLFLVFLAVCLPLAFAPAIQAQGEVKFSNLDVALWPEYDRPSVLVIQRITLSPEVSLPAELTLRIPAAAGEPHAVAVKQADGELYTINYDRQVMDDWGLITFTAAMPEVHLEYYDPGLVKQDDQREFEYRWPGDYAVDSFSIQVQQPSEASGMRISPALDPAVAGQDNLMYFNKQIGSLAEGEPFTITFSYQKSTDSLSTQNLTVEPGPATSSPNSLRSNFMVALPWILGVLGVVLIAGGGWWYWQSGRGQSRPAAARRRHRPASTREAILPEGHVYCHNCGKRAGAGDRFCRTCGTKLRVE